MPSIRVSRSLWAFGLLALAGCSGVEQAVWQEKGQAVAYLAKRFAAKEAFVKALGLGLRQGMQWGDIQVLNDALGKPSLKLSGEAQRRFTASGATAAHITLSDEADYAVAFVILES